MNNSLGSTTTQTVAKTKKPGILIIWFLLSLKSHIFLLRCFRKMRRVFLFCPKTRKDLPSSPWMIGASQSSLSIKKREFLHFPLVSVDSKLKYIPLNHSDDTEEPIFPRNDHNKPIVPKDPRGFVGLILTIQLGLLINNQYVWCKSVIDWIY